MPPSLPKLVNSVAPTVARRPLYGFPRGDLVEMGTVTFHYFSSPSRGTFCVDFSDASPAPNLALSVSAGDGTLAHQRRLASITSSILLVLLALPGVWTVLKQGVTTSTVHLEKQQIAGQLRQRVFRDVASKEKNVAE